MLNELKTLTANGGGAKDGSGDRIAQLMSRMEASLPPAPQPEAAVAPPPGLSFTERVALARRQAVAAPAAARPKPPRVSTKAFGKLPPRQPPPPLLPPPPPPPPKTS